MLSLTQLQYIVAVERHGSFSQAAKACHVTQPTLSMQVKKLEDDLGVVIFDRSAQPIRATPIGRKILEQSAVVLSQAARLQDLVNEAKDRLDGMLQLSVIPTVAPYVLPLFLQRFSDSYPGVQLKVEERTTDAIIDALREQRTDVGLLATPLDEPMLHELPLFHEPFYVYAKKGSGLAELSQVSDSDLSQERVLLLSEGHCLRTQVMRVCGYRQNRQKKAQSHFEFESGSIETLCHMVDKGLGYTVIPHLAKSWNVTRNGRVIPFSEPQPSREVSLVVHESFARDALLRALAQCIVRSLPPELQQADDSLRTIKLR
jgi:LysR family transcriptional regulator, hydrogen peroxide-inducible genes activator